MDKKRSQQFNYAFEALPVIFHSQTTDFFTYLDRDGKQFLEFWWDHVGMRLDDDKLINFDPTCYEVRELEEKKSTMVLVTLPKPQEDFEVYLMALVRTPKKRLPVNFPNTRVFVLEKVPESMSETETIFGEITPRGRYLRLGDGTAPDLETFTQRVIKSIWKK